MKFLLLPIVCIVLLTACSNPAPTTASVPPTQTQLATPTQTELPIPTQTEPPVPTDTPSPTPAPTPNGVQACVQPYRLTVRNGPGTTYAVVGVLKKDTCIFTIARNPNNTWFWEISNDTNGWVAGAYLSPKGNLNALPLMTEVTQTPGAEIQNPVASATIQP